MVNFVAAADGFHGVGFDGYGVARNGSRQTAALRRQLTVISLAPGCLRGALDRTSNADTSSLGINHLLSSAARFPLEPAVRTPTPSSFDSVAAMEDDPPPTLGGPKRSPPEASQAK